MKFAFNLLLLALFLPLIVENQKQADEVTEVSCKNYFEKSVEAFEKFSKTEDDQDPKAELEEAYKRENVHECLKKMKTEFSAVFKLDDLKTMINKCDQRTKSNGDNVRILASEEVMIPVGEIRAYKEQYIHVNLIPLKNYIKSVKEDETKINRSIVDIQQDLMKFKNSWFSFLEKNIDPEEQKSANASFNIDKCSRATGLYCTDLLSSHLDSFCKKEKLMIRISGRDLFRRIEMFRRDTCVVENEDYRSCDSNYYNSSNYKSMDQCLAPLMLEDQSKRLPACKEFLQTCSAKIVRLNP
ncbi:MAG: hypothetical protein MHMPM18_003507 [Marteilia pararefringens]